MGLTFAKILIQIAISVLGLPVFVLGECEPMVNREHVVVTCKNPATNETVDCYSKKLPTGTVGLYACVQPYYVPLNPDIEGGKLICNKGGKWSGRAQFLDFSCTVNCGIPPVVSAVGFVIGGTETTGEMWPWHASIYARQNSSDAFRYVCGGTLVRPFNKGFIILTAAHCLADSLGKVRQTADVKIVLGGEFSSLKENEALPGTQIHKVRRIVLHKSYEEASNDYHTDIGMVTLGEEVKLSNSVLPACFSGSVDEAEVGARGDIVGFGSYSSDSEDAVSLVLRNVTLPVVDPAKCFEGRGRKLLTTEICGGYNASQGACNGDNGGGFLFLANANGAKRYYIQGILSHGKKDLQNQKETCDSFSVFTRVNSYTKWIRNTVVTLFNDDEDDLSPLSSTTTDEPAEFTTEVAETSTSLPSHATSPTTTMSSPPLPPREPATVETTRVPTTTTTSLKIPDTAVPIRVHQPASIRANISPKLQEYELKSLQRHNHYRRMHAASDVRFSSRMKQRAQAYADKLIREGTFENENEEGINKNVYYVTGSRVKPDVAVLSAVDSWYEDIESYNWENPYYSTFSQIVWKGTTDIGTGLATDSRRTIVVVAYYPPGNILGENGKYFRQNVSPKRTMKS